MNWASTRTNAGELFCLFVDLSVHTSTRHRHVDHRLIPNHRTVHYCTARRREDGESGRVVRPVIRPRPTPRAPYDKNNIHREKTKKKKEKKTIKTRQISYAIGGVDGLRRRPRKIDFTPLPVTPRRGSGLVIRRRQRRIPSRHRRTGLL